MQGRARAHLRDLMRGCLEAELIKRAPKMRKDEIVILNLSGRGDKDMEMLSRYV